jgi:hypothetical protein
MKTHNIKFEKRIFGHLVTVYGRNLRFILRIYTLNNYCKITFSTIKDCQYGYANYKILDWKGNFKNK